MDLASSDQLASYLNDTLYAPWKRNRAPLEEKWTRNWEAFRGIVTGTWKAAEGTSFRSNSNINLTRQKCMAAFSLILAQVVRGGRIACRVSAKEPGGALAAMLQAAADAEQRQVSDILDEQSRLVQERVDDILSRCDAERVFARNILSSAVYGETYAKETTITLETPTWVPELPPELAGADVSQIDPAQLPFVQKTLSEDSFCWTYVPVWEIVRDLETDDLQAGAGLFHCRRVSPFWLNGLKNKPGARPEVIRRVISEASSSIGDASNSTTPIKDPLTPGLKRVTNRSNSIEYREFHGRVPVAVVEQYEATLRAESGADDEGNEPPIDPARDELRAGDEVEIIAGIANGVTVWFVRNDGGTRPFTRAVWEDALDDICGQGQADNVEDVHRVMTGAFRAFEDGCKAASALILVLRESLLTNPEDISKGIQSGFCKIQMRNGPHTMRDAMEQLKLVNPAVDIVPLIEQLRVYLDEESLLPRITSGLGESDATTAYEYGQRLERAGTYIGSVIRNMDEGLTEPMVERIIRRLMEDPDYNGPRGTFRAEAQGYAGFESRFAKIAGIYQLLQLIFSNETLTRRAKLDMPLAEIAASLDMQADQVWRTDAEMAEEDREVQARALAMQQEEQSLDGAKAAREQALAAKAGTDAAVAEGRLELDRVKAIADIEQRVNQPQQPAQQGKRGAPVPKVKKPA